MNVKALLGLSALILGLGIQGCTTSTSVNVNAVPQFKPENFNSFAILPAEESVLRPADNVQYRTARMLISSSLKEKGLAEASLEQADLVFQVSGSTFPVSDPEKWGFFWVGYDWDWYPVSYQRTSMTSQTQGRAVLSAFDNKTKELVWQSTAAVVAMKGSISTQDAVAALKQILEQYPAKN